MADQRFGGLQTERYGVRSLHRSRRRPIFLPTTSPKVITERHGPAFTQNKRERRFCMAHAVYRRGSQKGVDNDVYHEQSEDCKGKQSSGTDQKIVAALSEPSRGVLEACLPYERRI